MPAPSRSDREPLERESTTGLLSRLVGDFTALLRNEVALAKAELAEVVEPWLAALIVGVVISAIGLGLLMAAKKKLLPPHVEIDRTRASVRSDVDVLARRI